MTLTRARMAKEIIDSQRAYNAAHGLRKSTDAEWAERERRFVEVTTAEFCAVAHDLWCGPRSWVGVDFEPLTVKSICATLGARGWKRT